jgi:GrpB-like predicted nucleotidyltransferase (UPF0157 family)
MVIESEAPIVLTDYDPAWPGDFERERRLLAAALTEWLAGPIEHIGSTAVPGLRAKPILDIMAGVHTLDGSCAAIPPAARLEYVYFPYRTDVMHWFCKPSPAARTHHLHLVPIDSQLWLDRLAFRDHLRQHPTVAAEYAVLKETFAERYRMDREAYTDAKAPFVARILGEARRRSPTPSHPRGPA